MQILSGDWSVQFKTIYMKQKTYVITEHDFLLAINNITNESVKKYLLDIITKQDANVVIDKAIQKIVDINKKAFKEGRIEKHTIQHAENRRSELIKNQTEAEKKLKILLKLNNVIYEFQKIVYTKRTYRIVDFYIPSIKLMIELDGSQHNNQEGILKDNLRYKELKEVGYFNLKRFTNSQIFSMTELEVKNMILSYKQKSKIYKPKVKRIKKA